MSVFILPSGKKAKRKSLRELLTVVAGLLAVLAFPVLAQDGTGSVPENAELRSYGDGWDCALGYQVENAECVEIDVPGNAYPTGWSYGSGWACHRGYTELNGEFCEAIQVPENAYLRSSGFDWECHRGYRQYRDTCVSVIVPDNAFLSGETSGRGWECERGFTASDGKCIPISVPKNGYLTNKDYGPEWQCERGFYVNDGRCEPIALPENSFLSPDNYGLEWKCKRGFEQVGNTCIALTVPANAHLDRAGNRWRCNSSFRRSEGGCVLGR